MKGYLWIIIFPFNKYLYEEELLDEMQKPQASCELKSLLPSLPLHLLAATSVSLSLSLFLWPRRPLGEGGVRLLINGLNVLWEGNLFQGPRVGSCLTLGN